MSNKTQPEIRFPEFTEAWEERKLGEAVDVRSGRDYKHLNPGNIPVYGTGGYMLSVDEALSNENDAIGIGRKGTIDKPYILKSPFWTVDTLFYSIPRLNYDIEFLYSIFQKINWKSKDESTGVPSLSKTTINSVLVHLPSSEEQQKIGSFFKKLDDTIALHQRKLDLLKETKKGFLQKMFPKNGAKVPEIRFPGFTEDWEQRKLREILSEPINDGPHTTPNLVDEGIPFISVDAIVDNKIDFNRKRGFISEETNAIYSKKYRPQFNDVYLVKSGSTVGKVAIVETNIRFNIWSPLAAMRTGNVSSPYFLYFLLQTRNIQDQIRDKASNGTQPNLGMKELGKFNIVVPSRDEQKKIGSFLNQIDNTITLHQRELDLLKETKKGFLQKMFV